MSEWIKTERGWMLKQLDNVEYVSVQERIDAKAFPVRSDREVSCRRNVIVSGTKGRRKMYVCLSEFIEYMDLMSAISDVRKKGYLIDMMALLMTKGLGKVSGCAQRQLFKMLQAMIDDAMNTETNIIATKKLLVCTMKALTDPSEDRIGSKSLWNKHIQTVANISTKMDQFVVSERVEDGLPTLTDLPKECIREIMMKFTDHKDLINLGKTCSDLYYMTQDSSLWQKLVKYHFTEKQMYTFMEDVSYIDTCESVWQQIHMKCSKKYGLKREYTDQLVICSACKTVHWMMNTHICWGSDEDKKGVYLEPISPKEVFSIFFGTPRNWGEILSH